MVFPTITALCAAVLAILQIGLMLTVGLTRAKTGVGIGDGGSAELALLIRRHANLTENAPIFLIVLALVELGGGATWAVAALAATFLLARVAHAIALSQTPDAHPLRPVGALGTVASIVCAAGYLLWLAVLS